MLELTLNLFILMTLHNRTLLIERSCLIVIIMHDTYFIFMYIYLYVNTRIILPYCAMYYWYSSITEYRKTPSTFTER